MICEMGQATGIHCVDCVEQPGETIYGGIDEIVFECE